jgi:dienelactone hydrolase
VITRRDLGRLAVTGALAAQGAQTAVSTYKGPLDGLEDKVNPVDFDPVAYTLERYRSAPLKLTFKAANRKEAEAWQKKLRVRLVELIGGFPERRTPLRAETLEVRDFPGYTREKFVFSARPGVGVLGYLLLPKKIARPVPAVVCIAGHGRGVDDIVGVDMFGKDRTERDGYQFDFAIQAAEHGLAAVAIEPMAFGCRRDPVTVKKGIGAVSCQPAAGSALLFGETMIAWRVWDVMRSIDWIESRPELDARRVGCMGISGGGTCTLFSAALEPRIKAAFVSGYLNTFRDCIMSVSHCIDNYVPGILNWAEMYDVAGLIAPRPMFAESGTKDPIFPIAGSREGFERVRKVYEVFGAGDRVQHEIFEGIHEFHGVKGLPFLAQALAEAS